MNQKDQDNLAIKCIEVMLSQDHCSSSLGIKLKKAGAGWAEMTMSINRSMVNGHLICHGGMIFSLADSTFACACNGYNLVTVASSCSIEYLRPAYLDEILTARAIERSRGKKIGVYDVAIHNQKKKIIALFRGKSFTTDKIILNSN